MRTFSTKSRRWEYAEQYGHDGQAWLEVMRGSPDEAFTASSAFDHDAGTYMGRGTVLQRDVSKMPIHPESDQMSQFMWNWSPFGPAGGFGAKTSLNTSSFGTQPIHMYVVDSTHPAATFRTFGPSSTAISTPVAEVETMMRGDIPLPNWAVPAQNHDRGMAVYDLGTGIMREYFMVNYSSVAPEAVWNGSGGYSQSSPGLNQLAEENYGLQQRRGISNVTGMHNSLGFIGIAEALNKKIDHALCFTAGAMWSRPETAEELLALPSWPAVGARVSWPARAADGKAERYYPGAKSGVNPTSQNYNPTMATHGHLPHQTPTHGQWGRLKAHVDPMFNPLTGRPYRPLTRLVIPAVQKRGAVATDTNLWVNAFNAEQGRTFAHLNGEDPWKPGGVIAQAILEPWDDPASLTSALDVSDFPWYEMQWAPIDWGRPSPDWNLRPGQTGPWWAADDPNRPIATSL